MRCFVIAAVAVAAMSCAEPQREELPTVLVVSAGHALEPFPSWRGTNAYALDLVYSSVFEDLEITKRGGHQAALRPRDPASLALPYLCDRLRSPFMVAAPQLRDDACVIEFDPRVDRERGLEKLMLDNGPYRMGWQAVLNEDLPDQPCSAEQPAEPPPASSLDRVVLCRRSGDGPDEIHLVAMPVEEQWQSFLARRIDVIPHTPALYRSWFEGMTSVRQIALEDDRPLGLYFNTNREPWSDVNVRKQVVSALDVDAISRVACKDSRCRELGELLITPRDLTFAAPAAALPSSMRLSVFEGDTAGVQAAKVIRHQLYQELGIAVDVMQAPITVFAQRMEQGDFDGLLLHVPAFDTSLPYRLRTIAQYDNPEIDGALAKRDVDEVSRVLRRDLPLVPLFRKFRFAVISSQFCGGHPKQMRSWLWLADLHLCDEEGAR